MYGHRFTSQYPNAEAIGAAKGIWEMGLVHIRPEMIKKALSHCMRDSTGGFPPTLPEFREWCQERYRDHKPSVSENKESYDDYYHAMCRRYPSLKHKLISPDISKAMIEEVREARKRGEKQTEDIRSFINKIFTKVK